MNYYALVMLTEMSERGQARSEARRGEHENESRTKSEAWLILNAPSRISLASFPVKNAETNYTKLHSSYLPSNAISDIKIKKRSFDLNETYLGRILTINFKQETESIKERLKPYLNV